MNEIRQNDMHDFVRNSLKFAKPFWRLDTWTIKGVMANKGNILKPLIAENYSFSKNSNPKFTRLDIIVNSAKKEFSRSSTFQGGCLDDEISEFPILPSVGSATHI